MAAANESARFAGRAEHSNVGPHTLGQLDADIRRVVASYPNRPIIPLFLEVRELRDRTFELLEGRQPPQYTRDLYLAAGVLCGVLANASLDLGNFPAAETQARTAFLCGELAGNNGLRSWVRGLQALIAYWDARPAEALRFAEAGEEFVPERGTAHVRLYSIAARAHARMNQQGDAIAALDAADYHRERVADEDTPGGMMAFPLPKQIMYAGTTHLSLGGQQHLREAEYRAQQAIRGYESDPPHRRRLGELSLARMDLAMARLGQGDLEGAAEQVHTVIAVAARRRTDSVTQRLAQFSHRLEVHPGVRSAVALGMHDAIASHRTRTAPALLAGGAQ